jgi:hypothetical protein
MAKDYANLRDGYYMQRMCLSRAGAFYEYEVAVMRMREDTRTRRTM